MRQFASLLIAALLWALPVGAAPLAYDLVAADTEVRFTYDLAGTPTRGTIPVASAEIWVDFQRIEGSSARIALDASQARAGVFIATEAMRGPEVLNTEATPLIRFQSREVRGSFSDARMEGLLTIRGTSRPVTLTGGVFRERGSDPDDLDRLHFRLRGQVDRHAFGASGFPGVVGPVIDIDIRAVIQRRDP